MAGRNPHHPAHMIQLRDHRPSLVAHQPLVAPAAAPSLEETLAVQHHDLQALLLDNQGLAATHVALKQELSAAQLQLRRASAAAASLKSDRDARVCDVLDRCHTLEVELRSLDASAAELARVRSDVQKLAASRADLSTQLQALSANLAQACSELQHLPSLQAEIESMHKELQRGRAAVEYEKRAHADNLEQSQAMEKNMVSMAHEVQKLRAELANAERRARAAVAANSGPMYSGTCGNPGVGFGGSSYANFYGMYQGQGAANNSSQSGSGVDPSGVYDSRSSHGAADCGSLYGSVYRGPNDIQRTHDHAAADGVSPYGRLGAVPHGAYDTLIKGAADNEHGPVSHGHGSVSHGASDMRRANAHK